MSSSQHPLHIGPKSVKQRFEADKFDCFFPALDVAMISLATFVIIAKYTFAVYHKRKPIFERMYASENRLG
jgi:hypothetical protein